MPSLKSIGRGIGAVLVALSLVLITYMLYWMASRPGSPLGTGFAVLFIIVGLIFLAAGIKLLRVAK